MYLSVLTRIADSLAEIAQVLQDILKVLEV